MPQYKLDFDFEITAAWGSGAEELDLVALPSFYPHHYISNSIYS